MMADKVGYNWGTNSKNTIYGVPFCDKHTIFSDFYKSVDMFKIARPVIVFGLALSMAVGLVYWIMSLFI